MAGCQVGRSPSMLAAYNRVSIIVDNTYKEKKKENEKNTTCCVMTVRVEVLTLNVKGTV